MFCLLLLFGKTQLVPRPIFVSVWCIFMCIVLDAFSILTLCASARTLPPWCVPSRFGTDDIVDTYWCMSIPIEPVWCCWSEGARFCNHAECVSIKKHDIALIARMAFAFDSFDSDFRELYIFSFHFFSQGQVRDSSNSHCCRALFASIVCLHSILHILHDWFLLPGQRRDLRFVVWWSTAFSRTEYLCLVRKTSAGHCPGQDWWRGRAFDPLDILGYGLIQYESVWLPALDILTDIYIYIARSLRGNEVETYMEDSILEVSAVRDGTCTVDLWLSAGRLLSLSHLSIRRSCPTVMQHVSLLELKITYSKRFDEANTACCGPLCLAQEIGYSASTLFSRWNLHLRSHSARLRKGARVQGMKGEDSKN